MFVPMLLVLRWRVEDNGLTLNGAVALRRPGDSLHVQPAYTRIPRTAVVQLHQTALRCNRGREHTKNERN